MTTTDVLAVERTAARAASAVPGVAELQPSLGQRLAGAATWIRRSAGPRAASTVGGIHADRTHASGGWTIEVRCVVHGDRRTVDVARDVHDQVRTAVASHLARHASPEPVDVLVTVTRITGPATRTPPTASIADDR